MYSMDAQVSPVNQIQCRGPLWVALLHGFYSVQDLTFGVSVLIVYRFLRCLTNQLLSFFASVWRPPNKIWFYFSRLTPCFRISPVLSGLVQQSWFGWMHKYQYIWHSFLCQDYFCSLVCTVLQMWWLISRYSGYVGEIVANYEIQWLLTRYSGSLEDIVAQQKNARYGGSLRDIVAL